MNLADIKQIVKGADVHLEDREKMLAGVAVMAAWTGLAIAGMTPVEPLIVMYQMILGGLGVFGAAKWQPK